MGAAGGASGRTLGRTIGLGEWRVDFARNELTRGSETVRLEPKVVEVLGRLAARAGDVVSREDLLAEVWPGVVVGDDALTQAIIKLRKALGDDAHQPRYIETISKRGYRLIAAVERPGQAIQPAPASVGPWRALALVVGGAVLAATAVFVLPRFATTVGMPWPIAADTRGKSPVSLPIVAVLPLANLSGDPKRDYFSDGITEDLITGLGRFSGLRVMSIAAVAEFKGKAATPQAVRAELGARYVVKGSVREADGKVRVAVELSDGEKGALLWSERYDGEGVQLFEIQDRIVRRIVSALHVQLSRLEQERVFTRPTDSLEAHDLVLRARALINQHDRRANREARALLAKARELAPRYGEVLNTMAYAEMDRAFYGWVEDPREALDRAAQLAREALAGSDTRAHTRAHWALSAVYSHLLQSDESLRHAEMAVALNPSDVASLDRRASALLHAGRVEEAIVAFEATQRLRPLPPGMALNVAHAYYLVGRHRESLELVEVQLARYPNDVMLHAAKAAALVQLGELEAARQTAEQVRRLSPAFDSQNTFYRFMDPRHRDRLRDGLTKAGLR